MVTFTEEIPDGKLHFLCSETYSQKKVKMSFSKKTPLTEVNHINTFQNQLIYQRFVVLRFYINSQNDVSHDVNKNIIFNVVFTGNNKKSLQNICHGKRTLCELSCFSETFIVLFLFLLIVAKILAKKNCKW